MGEQPRSPDRNVQQAGVDRGLGQRAESSFARPPEPERGEEDGRRQPGNHEAGGDRSGRQGHGDDDQRPGRRLSRRREPVDQGVVAVPRRRRRQRQPRRHDHQRREEEQPGDRLERPRGEEPDHCPGGGAVLYAPAHRHTPGRRRVPGLTCGAGPVTLSSLRRDGTCPHHVPAAGIKHRRWTSAARRAHSRNRASRSGVGRMHESRLPNQP